MISTVEIEKDPACLVNPPISRVISLLVAWIEGFRNGSRQNEFG
jgi:hypothetical protein